MTENLEAPEINLMDGRERGVFYARYSSPRQKHSSIEDQYRNCQDAAEENRWMVLPEYHRADHAKTGVTLLGRKGIQELLVLANQKPRPFDIVLFDDTSRLGRDVGDVCKLVDQFDYAGVKLYFVTDELMSGNESFREAFIAKASGDEQFSRKLGKRVRRGRIGRFDAGYNPGGICFGYRNEKVFDLSKKGPYGEPGLKGMKEVIDPEKSQVVLRIFHAADEDMSDRNICLMLGKDGIAPPQPTHKRPKLSWSKGAVTTILTNQRYLGVRIYGKTKEIRNPDGKKERQDRPQSEWRIRERNPELQIVPDDLFWRVQEKRKLKATRIGVKSLGGMTRTEASRKYLFSGLLRCGLCGGKLIVRTTKPTRYGCFEYQDRGLCTNKSTISQELLEREFIHTLSEKLRDESHREELIQMVFEQVQSAKNTRLVGELSAVQRRKDLETSRATQARHKENLVKAVRESGGLKALYEELELVVRSIERIDEKLAGLNRPPLPEVTLEQVREFVNTQIEDLEKLLFGAAEALKMDFQRRITQIVVTPVEDETGRSFRITGDVDLFVAPEGVVQTNQVYLIGLHHTIPIAFEVIPYKTRQKWALPEAA
jgi:DNA invertase Pin-like site-specific DNA recombinase